MGCLVCTWSPSPSNAGWILSNRPGPGVGKLYFKLKNLKSFTVLSCKDSRARRASVVPLVPGLPVLMTAASAGPGDGMWLQLEEAV